MYVARESFQMNGQEKSRTILFALVRLYDWDERQVLPHERTMPKPKADRLNLLRSTQSNSVRSSASTTISTTRWRSYWPE